MRWTAAGAIAAFGAFVAAIVGVPIALYQLVAVEDDVARLTSVSGDERKLREQIAGGNAVLSEFDEDPSTMATIALQTWVDETTAVIREIADHAEKGSFRLKGQGLGPPDELEAKLAYLRDELWPKVRAGYWAT